MAAACIFTLITTAVILGFVEPFSNQEGNVEGDATLQVGARAHQMQAPVDTSQLQQKFSDLEMLCTELVIKMKRLENERDENKNDLTIKIQRMEATIEEQKKRMDNLETENEQKKQQFNDLKVENKKMMEQMIGLQTENELFKKRVSNLEMENQKNNQQISEEKVHLLFDRLHTLETVNDQQETHISNLEKASEKGVQQILDLKVGNEKMMQQISYLGTEIEKKKQQFNNFEIENTTMQNFILHGNFNETSSVTFEELMNNSTEVTHLVSMITDMQLNIEELKNKSDKIEAEHKTIMHQSFKIKDHILLIDDNMLAIESQISDIHNKYLESFESTNGTKTKIGSIEENNINTDLIFKPGDVLEVKDMIQKMKIDNRFIRRDLANYVDITKGVVDAFGTNTDGSISLEINFPNSSFHDPDLP